MAVYNKDEINLNDVTAKEIAMAAVPVPFDLLGDEVPKNIGVGASECAMDSDDEEMAEAQRLQSIAEAEHAAAMAAKAQEHAAAVIAAVALKEQQHCLAMETALTASLSAKDKVAEAAMIAKDTHHAKELSEQEQKFESVLAETEERFAKTLADKAEKQAAVEEQKEHEFAELANMAESNSTPAVENIAETTEIMEAATKPGTQLAGPGSDEALSGGRSPRGRLTLTSTAV